MPTQNLTVRTATGEAVLCRRLWRWVVYPVLGILLNGDSVEALSRYAGYHVYFAALGSGFHNPLFTKEFSEGQGVPRVGGKDQIQLPSQKESVGFRVGYEKLNYKRAGFGLSLTYWQTDFDDVRFQYDEAISGSRIAEYLSPSHTYIFTDLNAVYLPWESAQQALGVYCLISLIGDREEYRIDKYTLGGSDLVSRHESRWKPRFGFGIGGRFFLAEKLSLWAEKRWIVGETFGRTTTDETGAPTVERQETLYAPIGSLGIALYF